jgi:hypothetical protein
LISDIEKLIGESLHPTIPWNGPQWAASYEPGPHPELVFVQLGGKGAITGQVLQSNISLAEFQPKWLTAKGNVHINHCGELKSSVGYL